VKSIITDLLNGAEVTFRAIEDRVVEIVYGHDDLFFSAVAPGRSCCDGDCEFYNRAIIADWDLPLVKRGATFWLVVENVRGTHGHMERWSAIVFRHPGIDTAEEALTAPRPGGDVE
jgi:hypothetical protein